MTQLRIPCVYMRGGTSKGCFLWAADLPTEQAERDRVLLCMYGSPDARQIDGIGGGDPLTSKAIILQPADADDVDVTYTFAQVGVTEDRVYYGGNCGNMLAGVAAFAVDEHLVPPNEPSTRVRILNTNTGQRIDAEVEVAEGRAKVDGALAIAGVPGTGAPIKLNFVQCEGSVSGSLLPTGRPSDVIDLPSGQLQVSLIDAATPFVFVRARDIGARGDELPDELAANEALSKVLESVRGWAAKRLGLCSLTGVPAQESPNVPRVAMVCEPKDYVRSDGVLVDARSVSLLARQMTMQRPHKTYAVTGAICTAVAARIEGSIVSRVSCQDGGAVSIGHPLGTMSVEVSVQQFDGGWHVERAALLRTARRIMEGTILVRGCAAGPRA